MSLRQATPADVARMVQLSSLKRLQYAAYAPVFWRPAADANEKQQAFFRSLVDDPAWICLVHEAAKKIDGFVVARVVAAPPVYDPGGKVCMIDDFAVADASLWPSVGRALHADAERIAALQGAVASVTVCGKRDTPKRSLLRSTGAEISSEWYVHPISDSRVPDDPRRPRGEPSG